MGTSCLWPRNMGRYQLRNFSKTSKPPRRPFEKERLDAELKLIGQYGLKNKKEIWRVRLALAKIRATARTLLTKDDKDPSRIFEGQALMRRMIRYGILDEDKQRLDYVCRSALRTSWSVVSRLLCSSADSQSRSTMPVCSFVNATSGWASRLCSILHGACRVAASHRVRHQLTNGWW